MNKTIKEILETNPYKLTEEQTKTLNEYSTKLRTKFAYHKNQIERNNQINNIQTTLNWNYSALLTLRTIDIKYEENTGTIMETIISPTTAQQLIKTLKHYIKLKKTETEIIETDRHLGRRY